MLHIHKASAGSGKTYNLAKNYIKLLLAEKQDGRFRISKERNRHRGILAITFTNKATEEMKRRIVYQLSLLAGIGGKESDYMESLCEELGVGPDTIRKHASEALRDLLSDFSNFNISTIDSFFQVVLRTFAREAELTGNYDVDLDDDTAIAMGVDRMLTEINRVSDAAPSRDPHTNMVRNWIITYMRNLMNEGKSFNIFNRSSNLTASFCKFVRNATSETYKLEAEKFNEYFSDPERIQRFAIGVEKLRRKPEMVDSLKAEWQAVAADNASGLSSYLVKAIDKLMDWTDPKSKVLTEYIDSHEVDGNTAQKGFKSKKYDAGVDDRIFWLVKPVYDALRRKSVLDVVSSNIYQLGLIYEVQRNINDNEAENNTILLRDTNEILKGIISEEEAPFIYERLGVRLKHFLIDEFQDTSKLQWQNLRELVSESLAWGHDNLIIGDEKQSIYRFRNSDVNLLAQTVPEEFAQQSELHGAGVGENTNYRSTREVVQFNNTIFKFMTAGGDAEVEKIYKGTVQQIKRSKSHGYVEARPYEDKTESLENMMEHIKRQLASGYTQGDITVLVYSHSDGALVINRLLEDNYNVMSEDSMKISASVAVRLIVSIMRDIDRLLTRRYAPADKTDNRSIAAIYSRYQHFLSVCDSREDAIAHAFSDEEVPDSNLDKLIEESGGSLSSLVERIIMHHISETEREVDNVYLCAFQDIILDFGEKPGADVHSFLKWWDMRGKDIPLSLPSEVDAIRVMTIHKSKGLEFPCVHIPFIDRNFNGDVRSVVWFKTRTKDDALYSIFDGISADDVPPLLPLAPTSKLADSEFAADYNEEMRKQLLDTMNVLYVGFTRAVDELIIGYADKEAGEKSTSAKLVMAMEMVDSKWVNAVMPGNSELLVSLTDKVEDKVLKIGEPTQAPESKAPNEAIEMPVYYTIDNPNIWNLSQLEDMELIATPRQRGIVLHKIMSGIRTVKDIPRTVKRSAKRGYIREDEVDSYIKTITEAIAESGAQGWFDGIRRVMNERPFITENGLNSESLRFRPDRIVWTAEGTIDVIDFKFGEEEAKKYFKQVKNYVSHIGSVYPGVKVRGFLWYPLKHRIVPVV